MKSLQVKEETEPNRERRPCISCYFSFPPFLSLSLISKDERENDEYKKTSSNYQSLTGKVVFFKSASENFVLSEEVFQ